MSTLRLEALGFRWFVEESSTYVHACAIKPCLGLEPLIQASSTREEYYTLLPSREGSPGRINRIIARVWRTLLEEGGLEARSGRAVRPVQEDGFEGVSKKLY